MATTDSVNEHMARLKLKMMQQKLAKEKYKRNHRGSDSDMSESSNNIRLQQAMLKRQSLLDRIRMTEHSFNDRKRSHSVDRGPDIQSSPASPRPPSRRSLPEQSLRRSIKPQVLEPLPKTPTVRHIEPPEPVKVIQQPTYISHPSPVIVEQPMPSQKWNKSDYMEMMMMENVQMHQHMMRQMMYQSMQSTTANNKTCSCTNPNHSHSSTKFTIPLGPPPVQQPQMVSLPERRPPSVHHHHYSTPQVYEAPPPPPPPPPQPQRPYINHVTHLPPLETRPPPPPVESVRIFPAEIEPLRHPTVRDRPLPKPAALRQTRHTSTVHHSQTVTVRKHAFPGSRALRKLRHIFYAAWFIAFLKAEAKKNKKPTSRFLFGIKLKEAVAALHRIYLNRDGRIFPILSDAVGDGAIDLTVDPDTVRPSADDKLAFQELVYIIENLTYNITEIMPDEGVLGTHKKAAVFELIQEGKQFPTGYFWAIEKDLLEFDRQEAIKNVGEREAFMLLLGIFVSRSLVTTLMMKPLDYGLSTTVLGDVAERNLRLIATIFVYIVRKTSVPINQPPLNMPYEISRYLYSDEEMRTTFSRLKKTIDYAERLFRDWGEEYVRRLQAAGPLSKSEQDQ